MPSGAPFNIAAFIPRGQESVAHPTKLSLWRVVWRIGLTLILIAGVFGPNVAFAVSRTYFMYFNRGTTLTQPAVTTNTTCPTSTDTQLNGVSGIGLMADVDDTTCVPASNRDVTWDAANTRFSLYYKGTGYTSSMNVTGTSVGVSIRTVTNAGNVTVVKLFYTTSGNNKVYFVGTPPTQVATTTRTTYTINLSGLSATNVPAGSKIGVEFSWPSAPSGMRLSVNQNSNNEKLIVDETSPTSPPIAANPASFNCVESGANASTGTIYTKLAGTAFSFDVAALKADGSVETGYAASANKNVTVELVDGSGSTTCASRTPVNPVVSQTLTFAAANSGRKATASITVSKAYSDLRCRVTDANQSPSIVGCSIDNFAVRPTGFSVTSNINADATGVSTSASPAIKTGASFTLTAASGTAGYKYTPQLDASKLTAHAGAIQSGALAGSFAAAAATTGSADGTSFTYSEAGYFKLAANGIYDNTFTAVDSATNDCTSDFSNVPVSGKYGCKFGNAAATNDFGRFIPDHFVVTQGLATPACGTVFTYFGQDGFTTSFTLTAQNASNATTQNYTGSFAKLALTDWNDFVFTSAGLPAGSTLSASATAPAGTWSNGVAGVTAKHQVNRPTALTGQTTVIVNTSPVDTDGVTMVTAPVAPGTPLRYGRVNLGNAHGSELLDLAVPMQVEYFNGTSFITNTDDVCSVSSISITDPLSTDSLVPADSCVWDDSSTSGSFKCATAAPAGTTYREANSLSAGNFNLNIKAPGKTGALDITATVGNWLQFDWHGTGATNPSARATFGIYKGNQKIIYFREVY
jgi:hypothetical protein